MIVWTCKMCKSKLSSPGEVALHIEENHPEVAATANNGAPTGERKGLRSGGE
jgi:hypothetical protein